MNPSHQLQTSNFWLDTAESRVLMWRQCRGRVRVRGGEWVREARPEAAGAGLAWALPETWPWPQLLQWLPGYNLLTTAWKLLAENRYLLFVGVILLYTESRYYSFLLVERIFAQLVPKKLSPSYFGYLSTSCLNPQKRATRVVIVWITVRESRSSDFHCMLWTPGHTATWPLTVPRAPQSMWLRHLGLGTVEGTHLGWTPPPAPPRRPWPPPPAAAAATWRGPSSSPGAGEADGGRGYCPRVLAASSLLAVTRLLRSPLWTLEVGPGRGWHWSWSIHSRADKLGPHN